MSQVRSLSWEPELFLSKIGYLVIKYAAISKRFETLCFFLFHNDQMQKFGSTRNKIGFKYSMDLNELYVREVFVSKFHTSVVTLKI